MTDEHKFTVADLMAMKNADLVQKCRELKLPVSGKKEVLVARILAILPEDIPSSLKKVIAPRKKVKKYPKTDEQNKALLKSRSYIPVIHAKRNIFNNFEELDTHLVFSAETKEVIGIQVSDGTIRTLKSEELEICRLRKLSLNDASIDSSAIFENNANDILKKLQDEDFESSDDENNDCADADAES